METDIVLSQFENTGNRHRAYREKAQEYADEESPITMLFFEEGLIEQFRKSDT